MNDLINDIGSKLKKILNHQRRQIKKLNKKVSRQEAETELLRAEVKFLFEYVNSKEIQDVR